jgi:homogentisate 1,2-dioxygenase
VCHQPFQHQPHPYISSSFIAPQEPTTETEIQVTPNQLRWSPFDIPTAPADFIEGWRSVCGSGSPSIRNGMGVHIYVANKDMKNKAFYNSDGDLLIVPQQGTLTIKTEFGMMSVAPNEIAVIPRGVKYSVNLAEGPSRGYLCEVFNGRFELPDLGPIGANGLANPRDFLTPVAAFEDLDEKFLIVNKFQGHIFVAEQDHSPFDVVAWHGNYVPFKYDLNRFCVVNSTSFDHLDPSIFTVLTCKSAIPGMAICDFAIFPPRWAVQYATFRPPYYHRNVASEFMGIVYGTYEAKKEGFLPGGASLHSFCTPHGPDAATFESGSNAELKPVRVADNSQSFMFESSLMLNLTKWALVESKKVQSNYLQESWGGLKKHFTGKK